MDEGCRVLRRHFACGVHSLMGTNPIPISLLVPLFQQPGPSASLQLQLAGPGHEPSWLRSWLLERANTISFSWARPQLITVECERYPQLIRIL